MQCRLRQGRGGDRVVGVVDGGIPQRLEPDRKRLHSGARHVERAREVLGRNGLVVCDQDLNQPDFLRGAHPT